MLSEISREVLVQPLSELVEQRTEKVTDVKDSTLPYVGLEHMAQESPNLLGTSPSSISTSTNSVFEAGDILFGKLRPNLRKCVQVEFTGYCSTDILVLRVRSGTNSVFAAHALQRGAVSDEAVRTSEGTKMPRTSWSKLKEFLVFVPPLPEQKRIAEILDSADKAIEKTEAVISKLKLTKRGLMHDLLTRGMDEQGNLRDPEANPEHFKDSPLGRIPGEWDVRVLGSIAEIGAGVTLGRDLSGPATIELPYLRVANVQDGYVDLSEIKTVRVPKSEAHRYKLRYGDVLMNEGGDFDKLGRGTVWREEIEPCLHQNHVFRVRPDRRFLVPDFLAAVSSSTYGKRFFVLSSKQSTNLASINSTQLKNFPVPCPKIEEQHRITEVLNAHDERIRSEEAYLAKLRLTKRGLMEDLLTDRVRVGAEDLPR